MSVSIVSTMEMKTLMSKVHGEFCPKCGDVGDSLSSDFGETSGSRRFQCMDEKCQCRWEVTYTVTALTKTIDE